MQKQHRISKLKTRRPTQIEFRAHVKENIFTLRGREHTATKVPFTSNSMWRKFRWKPVFLLTPRTLFTPTLLRCISILRASSQPIVKVSQLSSSKASPVHLCVEASVELNVMYNFCEERTCISCCKQLRTTEAIHNG